MTSAVKDRRMYYGTLVARIASLTGLSDADVRKVLSALPDVVMECQEGEQVRTPLGAFKVVRRKLKRVRSPGGTWAHAPERLQARIRPGKKLQREDASGCPTRTILAEEDLDPDLDPEDPPA
jgi:nucleoid DNA-binding protein